MVVACFDIGGTGVKAGLIDQGAQMLYHTATKTPATLEELLSWMRQVINQATPLTAISLSVPGAVDYETGRVIGISAVPYIHDDAWPNLLASYEVPVYVENDGNCVGLSQLAVHPEVKNFACVVSGTGIGGALVLDGRLVRGVHSFGGEFGYMVTIPVEQPVSRTLSKLAATGGLVEQVRHQLGDLAADWDGKRIFKKAKEGNVACQTAIQEMVHHLAIGLINLQYIVDPEIIYIGGGIAQNKDYIQMVHQELDRLHRDYINFPLIPQIEPCYYKQDANLYGAYVNSLRDE